MSDYEWDGWLNEKLVVFWSKWARKKGKRKRRMRKIPIVFGSCFFSRSSSEIDREGRRRRRKRRIGIRLKTENARKAVVILSLHKTIRQKQLAS